MGGALRCNISSLSVCRPQHQVASLLLRTNHHGNALHTVKGTKTAAEKSAAKLRAKGGVTKSAAKTAAKGKTVWHGGQGVVNAQPLMWTYGTSCQDVHRQVG